jgi:battenin
MPFIQLVYQSTVFLSRSSLSLGLPPLPERLLPLPSIFQGLVLLSLAFESAVGIFRAENEGLSILVVFVLVSIEGMFGGLA